MHGRFLEIPVFLRDYFIMPHPVDLCHSSLHSSSSLDMATLGQILY